MKIRIILLLIGIGLFSSCNNNDDSDFQTTEISFTEIGKGELFGNGQEGITPSGLTISNNNEWQNLISQVDLVNNTSDNFTETDINFNEFTVIAIFLEIKPSGWEVEIQNIAENENNLVISTTEHEYATSVITQPFHIVKIPKTEKLIIVE